MNELNIAVLFDGAGLARLGLEQAGHTCTGFELDAAKHHLSQFVGSGNCVLADVRDVDLSGFNAVWASPPCQERSQVKLGNARDEERKAEYDSLLEWSLSIPKRYPNIQVLWVENVIEQGGNNTWGKRFNAAQFLEVPIQNRNRIIGGCYKMPFVWRKYQAHYAKQWYIPTAVVASEYKASGDDRRKASYFYGRRMTVQECAYHQGFEIPPDWFNLPDLINAAKGKPYTAAQWRNTLYEAIGNGVPCYMARAFGEAYTKEGQHPFNQLRLW